jgi:hypothetical protein
LEAKEKEREKKGDKEKSVGKSRKKARRCVSQLFILEYSDSDTKLQ